MVSVKSPPNLPISHNSRTGDFGSWDQSWHLPNSQLPSCRVMGGSLGGALGKSEKLNSFAICLHNLIVMVFTLPRREKKKRGDPEGKKPKQAGKRMRKVKNTKNESIKPKTPSPLDKTPSGPVGSNANLQGWFLFR